MSRVTFYGLPAWVGAIQSPTICEWWNRDPAQLGWDRSLLYRVDLGKTPSAALAGRIKVSEIEVDDYTGNGGRTTIGPLWPSGNSIGALWVSDGYLARSGADPKAGIPPAASGHDYEYMILQYFGEQSDRRFYGFHGNLLQVNNGQSLVELWNPGTGLTSGVPAGTWWLDLAATADPGVPPLVPHQPGPVFLDATTVASLTLLEPKSPPFKGGFAFPN